MKIIFDTVDSLNLHPVGKQRVKEHDHESYECDHDTSILLNAFRLKLIRFTYGLRDVGGLIVKVGVGVEVKEGGSLRRPLLKRADTHVDVSLVLRIGMSSLRVH